MSFFTQKSSDNWDRVWIYIIYTHIEMSLCVMFFINISVNNKKDKLADIDFIDWKINEFDFCRYGFILVYYFPMIFKKMYKCCRFCQIILKNFSKHLHQPIN